MKKKILSWVYHICKKILTTEKIIQYPYIRHEVPIINLHHESYLDTRNEYPNIDMEKKTIWETKQQLLQIIEPYIQLEKFQENQFYIRFIASIRILPNIPINGTDKKE
ncbi:MAG: hypothetical protein WC827_03840 [Candidatus Paceibacterota bacterium]|jgi:hypothetical protein